MKNVKIDALRPTQATHGLREVHQKADAYRALSAHDLAMEIASKPVPIVLGPGGFPFAIDHHHVANALKLIHVDSVPVVLVADLSSCDVAAFWLDMENRRWTYPYDASGQRVPFSSMPRHIWDLVDDEYRSVAAFVRDAGGYEKTTVPLEEFRWADFFRAQLPRHGKGEDFASRVRLSLKLAKSDLACGLPGYLGPAQSRKT